MRLTNSQPLKDVLENYVRVFKLTDKLNEVKLHETWEKLMGTTVNKHTSKLEIRKNILYVFVDNAALRSELSYSKSKIIVHVNNIFGKNIISEVVVI